MQLLNVLLSCQFLEGRKFCETTIWLDAKIIIYAISAVLGYLSHLYFKFPKDAAQVGMCLAAYCVLMTIHYYIETYKEKGAFFMCSSHEMGKLSKWQK